jgi:hypothetical protein
LTETPAGDNAPVTNDGAQLPPEPVETRVEAAARHAAEAAVAALEPRLARIEERPAPDPAPPAAPVPADLESRLDAMEHALRLLIDSPPAPADLSEADRRTIDDLRLANAENARTLRLLLDKENS